jgi:signal transduction histidine kinase/ligand-binding sensor domain-containing protein
MVGWWRRGRCYLTLGAVLAGILLLGPCAFALNPALDVSQYAHTAWKIREGFFKGVIVAIAQTPDGDLWLGTEYGLLRFDGEHFPPWQPPKGQHIPNIHIKSLLAARDGSLWIGSSEGLAKWMGGTLTQYPEFAGQSVNALLEDREGIVWAGAHALPNSKLCAIGAANVRCYGDDGRFGQSSSESPSGGFIDTLYEDRMGNLWVGGIVGLWRWKPGPPIHYPMPDRVQALGEGGNGSLIVAMLSGLRRFAEGKSDDYSLPSLGRFPARSIFQDRDGGFWIGTTDRGLVHLHQGRTDVFARADGLSADFVEKIFEDREGNIWVATIDGIDRFHDFSVATISAKEGLSNATVESVLVARDGSVWLGTVDGLDRWRDGQITIYRNRISKAAAADAAAGEPAAVTGVREITGSGLPDNAVQSLFQDSRDQIWVSTRRGLALFENGRFTTVKSVPGEVQSISGDNAGNLWVSQGESLFHLRDGTVVERIPWASLGRQDNARASVADSVRGGIWLGFRGSVAYYNNGQIRASYTVADGLGEGRVRNVQIDREGTLWASTEGGLSRLKDGRFATLNSRNGLPCDDTYWLMEDDDHSFWLYMACGLVRLAGTELAAWSAAADKDPKRQVQVKVFDAADGVRSHSSSTGFSPIVGKTKDGKLWFLPWDGVSIVDPHRLTFNPLPPPVRIERIIADRKTYDAAYDVKGRLNLPPLVRNLEIDYVALSFVAPEKVLFRYKLEGRDRDWQDVGIRRQAYFDNLPPNNYRFRVQACNNSGVWNEAGASLDLVIAPMYYQTNLFRLSCVAAFLVFLGALYQLRLRQVERQFNGRLEERLAERTRIAQELHDTLLQGFVSASMHLDVAAGSLPADSKAKPMLTRTRELMRQVIDEGRNAVRGLRSHGNPSLDLEQAFSQVYQEHAANPNTCEPGGFRVMIEGQQKPLNPLLRDEVYRIGREALINAFRHSHAKHIEVEIKYSPSQLRILVRDDGCGVDTRTLTSGRDGHWGLSGMRERADRIGARLHICSGARTGTEVELSIPGNTAFLGSSKRRLRWFG